MKNDIATYQSGVIKDFMGKEHPFIVCALSTCDYNVNGGAFDESTSVGFPVEFPRAVFLGVSVCNPNDEWNEEKGKMIALAKAKGFKARKADKAIALFATRAGLISDVLVSALLVKEVDHIKEDPECAIPGYNQMKRNWEKKQEQKRYIEETREDLRNLAGQLTVLNSEDLERVLTVTALEQVED